MQTYARLADGVVVELIPIDADGPPLAERFHCSLVAAMVPVPASVSIDVGWHLVDGVFMPPPPVPPPTAETVRRRRNAMLTACDWTQAADAPLTTEVRAAWASYRAALRDVPEQPGFPADVAWPVAPG